MILLKAIYNINWLQTKLNSFYITISDSVSRFEHETYELTWTTWFVEVVFATTTATIEATREENRTVVTINTTILNDDPEIKPESDCIVSDKLGSCALGVALGSGTSLGPGSMVAMTTSEEVFILWLYSSCIFRIRGSIFMFISSGNGKWPILTMSCDLTGGVESGVSSGPSIRCSPENIGGNYKGQLKM